MPVQVRLMQGVHYARIDDLIVELQAKLDDYNSKFNRPYDEFCNDYNEKLAISGKIEILGVIIANLQAMKESPNKVN